jgi:hypothetical protein
MLAGIFGGAGAGAAAGAGASTPSSETPKNEIKDMLEELTRQVKTFNENVGVARLTQQLGANEAPPVSSSPADATNAEAAAVVGPESAAAVQPAEASVAIETPMGGAGAAVKVTRLPPGAAAAQPMPPTEADALLTKPNVEHTIQQNEAAAVAAEAAKQAAAAQPTTVNVMLPAAAAAAPAPAPMPMPAAAAQAPGPMPPQSGGGAPTLNLSEVSANEGVAEIAAPPGPGPESEFKILSVTAFDVDKKK